MATDNYIAVQLEDIQGKIDAILEVLAPMRQELSELKNRYNEDIPTIKRDIRVIKTGLKITNDHEQRTTRLEATPA